MPDVFISYARHAAPTAKRMAAMLEARGLSVWFDAELPPHRAFAEVIQEELERAKAVVVLWSAQAVASEWVRAEADFARNKRKLVQASLDGALPPMPFNQIQCAQLKGWRGRSEDQQWGKLVAAVEALSGAEPAAPTQAPARDWRNLLTGKQAMAGAAAVGALALAAAVWWALGQAGLLGGSPRTGVAVMPIDAPAGDAQARAFADGVADEVAGALARVGVKSLPSGAGGSLSGPQQDAAALRLGAAFALSGHVQREGDSLKVSVSVDDARRHAVVWSGDFSHLAAQASSLQQEVAAKTAAVLHCTLDASRFKGGRMNDESLALYLRGCDWQYSDATGAEGPALLRKVTEREPDFAPGWAKFALVSASVGKELPPDESAVALREARAAAEKALKLDPKLGTAYAALAVMIPAQNLSERQGLLQKGLSVAPDSPELNAMESDLMAEVGRYNDAVAYSERAASLDPLQTEYITDLSTNLAVAGRIADGHRVVDRAVQTWPDSSDIIRLQMSYEARWGDPDRALALLKDLTARGFNMDDALTQDWRTFALIRKGGDPALARNYVQGVVSQVASGKMDPSLALVRLNTLGATDAAFTIATGASADDLYNGDLFRPSADGKAMWRDPRFMPLVAKLGMIGFWRRTDLWPDFCDRPTRPYDCRAEAARLRAN